MNQNLAPSETSLHYARDWLAGKIVSGQKHKWACQRFLRDWEAYQSGSFPYHWDEREAVKIIDWFRLLRHSKGVLAGQPIELTPWQQFHLCQLYGWRDENGRRRFTKSFVEVGRKNARIWRPQQKCNGLSSGKIGRALQSKYNLNRLAF